MEKKLSVSFLSLLFCILICMMLVPSAAFAEGKAAESGKCGDKLTWEMNSSGTLTISGAGEIQFDQSTQKKLASAVYKVVIKDGVTGIGDGAFKSWASLTDITIPAGVTFIGNQSFEDCSSLTSVSIPSGVTSIGYMAFAGCHSLQSVTIPSSVENIGYSAFSSCINLASISIPSGM